MSSLFQPLFVVTVMYILTNVVEVRRLRSVERELDQDKTAALMNSVEYIWGATTVAVGDTAVLHCSFDAIFQQLRTGSIDWVKESTQLKSDQIGDSRAMIKIATGKQLSISDRRYRVYRPHNSALSVLIIRRTRRQDAGIYRCNLAGSTTRHKFMILNVTESKIEAQTSPAKMIAKAGSDVTLWCNATGYPKPVAYWTREDRHRKLPDGNYQFWGNELHFEKASATDTGIYTCYLDNFVQPVVSYKFSLMVEDNPWNVDGSKMRFDSSHWYSQDSPDPRPMRGRSYLLLCETRGSPQPLPSIAWYRDGRPLRSSKHFYIIEDTPEWRSSYTSSTLVIMRFMADFQGNYTCVASNAFRMKKQSFELSELPTGEEDAETTPRGQKSPTPNQNSLSPTSHRDGNPQSVRNNEERTASERLKDAKKRMTSANSPTTPTSSHGDPISWHDMSISSTNRKTKIRNDVARLVGNRVVNATQTVDAKINKNSHKQRLSPKPVGVTSITTSVLPESYSFQEGDDEDDSVSSGNGGNDNEGLATDIIKTGQLRVVHHLQN